MADDITFFAETNFRDQKRRFGIKRADRRKHVYMVGKTGMGKTTLLENMAIQDIQNGNGVGIVDPHGEFAEKMLDFVPKERVKDVVYFNPADTAYPVAFNSMETVLPEQRHLISSGLLGVFKKIWPDVWSARMEYLLSNAILALLEVPGSTLLGINRMFGDKEFRKSVVSKLADPVVRAFWEKEYAQYQERFATEASAAIQNKVGQFISNPLIRNIIGQERSSVDMRQIMDEGKIFIMNISKGKVGEENSRLLGAMLVTKLYLTAMTRVDIPREEDRRDFYLYVDEFQNFATESFASILSESRKYRLNLTLAHQYITQMEEEVRDAVLGNVGTMIIFRIGAQDAESLENEFTPEFMPQDLVNLGFAQIYLKLMIDGIASRPFSALTLPPFPKPSVNFRDDIIAYSRSAFGTPAAEVTEKIEFFHGLGLAKNDPSQTATGGSGGTAGASAMRNSGSYGTRSDRKRQDDRKFYEAFCFVDGEKVMVPFIPDRRRPVYCEKHLEMLRRGELSSPDNAASRDRRSDGAVARHEPMRTANRNFVPLERRRPASAVTQETVDGNGAFPSNRNDASVQTGFTSRGARVSAPPVRAGGSSRPLTSSPRSAPAISLDTLRPDEDNRKKVEGQETGVREDLITDKESDSGMPHHIGGIAFQKERSQKRAVDLAGLRQALEVSLKSADVQQKPVEERNRADNKKSGVVEPGEKVTFE